MSRLYTSNRKDISWPAWGVAAAYVFIDTDNTPTGYEKGAVEREGRKSEVTYLEIVRGDCQRGWGRGRTGKESLADIGLEMGMAQDKGSYLTLFRLRHVLVDLRLSLQTLSSSLPYRRLFKVGSALPIAH